jgi:superkiller protein 3
MLYFFLSKQYAYFDQDNVFSALSDVLALLSPHSSDRLLNIVALSPLRRDLPNNALKILEIAIVAYDYRIALASSETVGKGSDWFDLGVALHSWATRSLLPSEKQEKAIKQANKCILHALREEPGNDTYWSALGCLHFTRHPKIAQHAFIKALEFDSKVGAVVVCKGLVLRRVHATAECRDVDESRGTLPSP